LRRLQISITCELFENEYGGKKLITNVKSANIKIFCDRCNVSLSAISEVKASVDELKATFESRLEQLENLIKQSTSAPNEKESVINESVERSWRARNVIIYNVRRKAGCRHCE
jgi:DNA polymerase II small subunit/DNA polymerase delta subunit B